MLFTTEVNQSHVPLDAQSPKQTDYTASFSNDVTLPEPAGVASRILTSTSAP
ncbi:hypothetical protein MJO28_016009 [Puccinia striiformis f. sp. tritici]|uniref:Uncharacterized protein n=1 Tax=Puccinia striiformis f. sp. tritici TaxID=168172 RepID=A0ACC0DSB0_9BASI|nr:hypothetical protein MJO29_015387 [Puccinia striiformis f. sp. tritici]KAI7937110.1 hypothetical protein MJO28_016009 [Puccinia striiformis f. sp. tritici]